MRIGKINYKLIIKIEKTPVISQLRKDIKGLLDNFYKDVNIEFEIEGNNFMCSDLECDVYYERIDEKFGMYLQKIGKQYGINNLSFPYWYYHK